MSDVSATENSRRFADLTDWHNRNYWREVILRAGPLAGEMQYVCSIRVGGIHWSLAHAMLSARQCIDAILGHHNVGQFDFVAKLNSIATELLAAVLLEGRQTDLVTPLSTRWCENRVVMFRDGTTAQIETIGRRALYVRIHRDKRDVTSPTFYVLARTTGELVDMYIVSDSAVATWNGQEYRTNRPPPPPAIAKSCEIDIPHPRAFLRAAKATKDRDPLD